MHVARPPPARHPSEVGGAEGRGVTGWAGSDEGQRGQTDAQQACGRASGEVGRGVQRNAIHIADSSLNVVTSTGTIKRVRDRLMGAQRLERMFGVHK